MLRFLRHYVGPTGSALVRWTVAVLLTMEACAQTACVPALVEPTPIPPWNGDSSDVCEAACGRRKALGCLEAEFEDACIPVCRRAAARGLYSPACVLAASTREELKKCRVRCP